MLADLTVLLSLIIINGLFAMSEIAIVSSRRSRLQQFADDGSSGARSAIKLSENPTRFLSTVQVGITSIGILSGAIGESTLAEHLRLMLIQVPLLDAYAAPLSLVGMVLILTYFSLIIGELVPKRIAMQRPEVIAMLVAKPMQSLSSMTSPLVMLLSWSTDTMLRLLGAKNSTEPTVTEEEIKVMIEQGTEEGVFDRAEQELVSNVLRLDDRNVGAVMTPRKDLVFLDAQLNHEENRDRLCDNPHSVIPLCDGGLDHVVGLVRSNDILECLLRGEPIDFPRLAKSPLFVPKTITLMQLLEHFKRAHLPAALVIDEYGEVVGIATVNDVIGAIVGDLPGDAEEDPLMIQREDGSWLVDGMLDLDGLKTLLEVDELPEEELGNFHTVGGLAMLQLGRVPRTGDVFELEGHRIEVLDMDKNRVDKLLISKNKPESSAEEREAG
ncbi:MAG TPA: hemolysin family protein [Rhodocyclaceae bacterium]|nr:hemolysin family protein [Rhodocyclaceae bacterium]